jgi:flavin-dependent dehydrogenase
MVEMAALRPPAQSYDVAILGGGLAGLTLSIQLKLARPHTRVLVLEAREGPAPLAAFKVGESTVACGAHYFSEVVGMHEHLHAEQLKKCGLRYFLPGEGNEDITRRAELGVPFFPPHDNFQLDRGLFENKLAARARTLGVDLQQGARVREVELGTDAHSVVFEQFDRESTVASRWLVDASGRAGILKRKLELGVDCGHHINSAWFRLGGGLDLEDWGSGDAAWMARMSEPGLRKLSTNHLMGEGYWVWLIPLSSGPISIGVCADPRFHPYEEINEFDRLLAWLHEHEPELAAKVAARLDDVEDFLRVRDFAYGVKQTYSTDRWSLVGEAAAFADPFYSPGSDFIGYGNTFTADIVVRELDGEDVSERVEYYNDMYQRQFSFVISRYRDSYPLFGNPWVLCGFLTWDFYASHVGYNLVFTQNRVTDLQFMKRAEDYLRRLERVSINMHELLREWHELERKPRAAVMPPPFAVLLEGLFGLAKEYPDEDSLLDALRENVRNSEAIAVAMVERAARALAQPLPTDRMIDPYVVGLRPDRWESDGVFAGGGMRVQEARQIVDGIDGVWDATGSPAFGSPSA